MNTSLVTYKIISDKNLIIEYYGGDMNLAKIINHKQNLIADKNYQTNYNIVVDFRDVNFQLNKAEVQAYVDFLSKEELLQGKRITVFITDKPEHVVLFTMFNSSKLSLPINVRIVSTTSKAADHLGFAAADLRVLESTIKKLKEE